MFLPGIDLAKLCDGRPLGDQWQFYTVNVKLLGTMTHEEFCREFPETAAELARLSEKIKKWQAFWEE